MKFTPVYRRQATWSKPRLGSPSGIQAGDYLTVFIEGAFHSRICLSAHKGYVLTEPVKYEGHTFDSSRKILWDDIDDAYRPDRAAIEEDAPEVKPEEPVTPKKPEEPVTPKKPEETVTPKNIIDLWALLGGDM